MNTDTIKKRLQIIADLQADLNVLKEQYEDALEQDPTYVEAKEKEKQVKEEAKQEQAQVLDRPAVKGLSDEMREIRQEIKDNKEVLSHELVEFYKETGSMEFEDNEGNIKKLKFSVRLTN